MGGFSVSAQETNSPARLDNKPRQLDYSSFRIIAERNIFAARRSGRTGRPSVGSQRQAETFTLVGTLDSDRGPVAFFDGTSSEYRKALKAEGTIAGFKIMDIALKGVKLAVGSNTVELRVGMQVRRQDDGEWRPAAYGEVYTGPDGGASSGSAHSSGAGRDASDVLKRLMQQREQEIR